MTKIKLIFLVTALALGSCDKSNQDFTDSEKSGSQPSPVVMSRHQLSVAANPSNPYDSIGILHNLFLDTLRKYVSQTGDTSRTGKGAYLQQVARAYRGISFQPTDNPESEVNICTDYKSVLLNQPVSVDCKAILHRLVEVLDGVQSANAFNSYANKIKAIELEVMNAGFMQREEQFLLTVSSVMRHSGYYWMEAFNNGGVAHPMGLGKFLRKIAGLLALIGADATTAGYHYLKNSPYDHLILESAWMSEVCQYYTAHW